MNAISMLGDLGANLPQMPGWAMMLAKLTLLLGAVWALHAALGRANPRWRVLLWRVTCVGVVLLPLLSWVGPELKLELDRPVATVAAPEISVPDQSFTGRQERTAPLDRVVPQTLQNYVELYNIPKIISPMPPTETVDLTGMPPVGQVPQDGFVVEIWMIVLGLWLVGAGLVALRGVVGWFILRRDVRRAQAAPPVLTELGRKVAADLGCREVELRLTERVSIPFLTGWRKPVVLLPARMAGEKYTRQLPAILAHELSHVRSRDVFWMHMLGLVRAVLWFHPLAWGMRQAHAGACEEVSDAVSAAYIGDAVQYSRTLARVAVELAELPPPAAGGIAMARMPEVMRRLERLRRRVFADPISRQRAVACIVCGMIALAAIGGVRFAFAQEDAAEKPGGQIESEATADRGVQAAPEGSLQYFQLEVLDEQDQPITEAVVNFTTPPKEEGQAPKSVDMVTPSRGVVGYYLPELAKTSLKVTVRKAGYVPMQVQWKGTAGPSTIPDNFQIQLQRGTSIGGFVRNESGNPVSGATVYLMLPILDSPSSGALATPAIWDYPVYADTQGRWSASDMPADIDNLMIRLEHPDYISDKFYGATPRPSIGQLRDQSAVMVMHQGIRLTGRIVNASGEPMFDARVNMGATGHGHGVPGTMTDTNGVFVFENCDPGPTVLSIQAGGGWAPDLREVDVRPNMPPVDFKLQKSGTIRIRLEDTAGNPIQGRYINAEIWRGFETLNKYGPTNAEGRWVWTNAPQDEVQYAISTPEGDRLEPLVAREEEYVITIGGMVGVNGWVTDIKTGEPVEGLRIVPGYNDGGLPETPTWDVDAARDGVEGQYGITFGRQRSMYFLRAEAPGYKPVVSRSILPQEGAITINFQLEPSEPVQGLAVGVDNQPLADAGIILITDSSQVIVESGNVEIKDGATILKANSGGGFEVPPQDKAYGLLIVDKDGYALESGENFESDKLLQLKPWSRLEGKLMLGSQPGAQQSVGCVYQGGNGIGTGHGLEVRQVVRTDSRGQFVFEKLIEGDYDLQQFVSARGGQSLTALQQRVRVESGQARQMVILGGPGVTVTGRLVVAGNKPLDLTNQASLGVLQTRQPGTAVMREVQSVDGEGQIVRLLRAVTGQPAPQVAAQQQAVVRDVQPQDIRKYMFVVEPNGRFRIENVAPDTYELQIMLGEAEQDSSLSLRRVSTLFNSTIRVPDSSQLGGDGTLNLGNCPVSVAGMDPQSAGYMPEINIRKLGSDETHTMSDYRGKYVMLHVWAATAPNNLEDLIRLNDVYERYKDRENFVLLNLSVDGEDEAPLRIAQELGLEWFQGHLGLTGENGAAGLDLEQIPALFMVGPDGQILSRNFTADTANWQVRQRIGD